MALLYREAMKDVYLGPLKVYKGMYLTNRFSGACYAESVYKDPFSFNPDRWDEI